MTGNQVVAHNLRRARLMVDWSQEEAGERLARYLGRPWSKVVWSAAERSRVPESRPRRFDADEIVAFARLFDVPPEFFFEVPEGRGLHPVSGRHTAEASVEARA